MKKTTDTASSGSDSSGDPPGATANDAMTSVEQLRNLVRQFVRERDWEQFHSPKNLSMSLAIEAGELMEHFQWIDGPQSRALTETQIAAVGEELADVICYGIALANQLEIDLASTLIKKMRKNARKYPAEQFRGRFGYGDPNPPDARIAVDGKNQKMKAPGQSGDQE